MDKNALEQRLFKHRIVDKSLPTSINENYTEMSKLYVQLLEKEKKIDFRLIKKQLDIQEASFKLYKLKRILRIYLSSFYSAEEVPSITVSDLSAIPTNEVSSFFWTLRIDGRLLEFQQQVKSQIRKFSTFIKSIHVELDPTKYPNDGFIEWNKVHLSPESDGFEIKRKYSTTSSITGPIEIPIKVLIQLDTGLTQKYKLSSQLSTILNRQNETKPQIIMGLWQYIKLHKLQNHEDRRIVNCDETLQRVFNQEKINFSALPELIIPHLGPLDPIELNYTIFLFPNQSTHIDEGPFIDIEVDIEDFAKPKLPTLLTSLATTKEISLLEHKINELLFSIHKSSYKSEFMQKFVKDPVAFINNWVVSQARYLDDIVGGSESVPEEMKMSEFFNQPWAADMISHYLASCTNA